MGISVNIEQGVMAIGFDRLDRKNAITVTMYQAMADALRNAEQDANVRAVLIHGHLEIFTAGNDLEDFAKNPPAGMDAPVMQFLGCIGSATKPIVAAVSGPAVGIGTTLLMHCDMVYASEQAKFTLPFTQLGLCAEGASTLLLPQIAGYQRAAEKLLLGEAFDANEALAMGLVNRILPAAELHDYARKQCLKLVALPANSLRVTKRMMKQGQAALVQQTFAAEAQEFGQLLRRPEAKEAFAAFFEKRKPNFLQFQ